MIALVFFSFTLILIQTINSCLVFADRIDHHHPPPPQVLYTVYNDFIIIICLSGDIHVYNHIQLHESCRSRQLASQTCIYCSPCSYLRPKMNLTMMYISYFCDLVTYDNQHILFSCITHCLLNTCIKGFDSRFFWFYISVLTILPWVALPGMQTYNWDRDE